MAKWAVAVTDLFGNEMKMKIVEIDDDQGWKKALEVAWSKRADWLAAEDYEEAQQEATDQDWLFKCMKVE